MEALSKGGGGPGAHYRGIPLRMVSSSSSWSMVTHTHTHARTYTHCLSLSLLCPFSSRVWVMMGVLESQVMNPYHAQVAITEMPCEGYLHLKARLHCTKGERESDVASPFWF